MKMLCTTIIVFAIAMSAGLAIAVELEGRFGLGYFTSDAPVGTRYWFSNQVGIDLGWLVQSIAKRFAIRNDV